MRKCYTVKKNILYNRRDGLLQHMWAMKAMLNCTLILYILIRAYYCQFKQNFTKDHSLTLKALSKIVADNIPTFFFLAISCELYARQMIHMKYPASFFLKIKEKIQFAAAYNIFNLFFIFLRKCLDILCELSAKQTTHMKCQDLFSLPKKKKKKKK